MTQATAPLASPKPFQKKETAKEVAPQWKMPLPEPGDIVSWYQSHDTEECEPAVVTKVYPNSIEMSCFIPTANSLYPRTRVRHRMDPTRFQSLDEEGGFWDFRDGTKELLELLKDITGTTESMILNPIRALIGSQRALAARVKAIEDKINVKRPESV